MAGLQIKTRSNEEITLQEETVRKFKDSLRGELIRIGDAGYDDARSIWNAMIDRRPALIASCLGVADVVTCVNFAREHGITLSIKGGGHNISGLAVCEGGLIAPEHLALQSDDRPSASGTTNVRLVERQLVEQVLKECNGNKSKAARRLGLTRKQLYVRLRQYQLSPI